ncbi:uncharacterized protein L3040_004460 [Drepanopeziza brunnea f. sp. 'multigermtubi']|uniref:uncharacterized protein n=1 Tax=Drepanopeziza brunnea f. sp. 'multigermtubi' TaxID=698441 RepID=UPI002392BCD3|nr:hypothetical protein L3040_004460 [Drepanopeziza brunnea f. sp. 'multigermtubi']
MYDPNNPNIKSRNTLQWGLYQRELFWKDHDGEVPPLSTEPGDLEDPANRALTIGGWYYASSTAGQSYTHLGIRPPPGHHPPEARRREQRRYGNHRLRTQGQRAHRLCPHRKSTRSTTPLGEAPSSLGREGAEPAILSLHPPRAQSPLEAVAAESDHCAFYRGIGADLGLSGPVFQKRMEEAGVDPVEQPTRGRGPCGPMRLSGGKSILPEGHRAGVQVDSAIASLDALERIVNVFSAPGISVGDEMYIMFNSGVRGAADIFQALALAAKFAFVGRLWVWGVYQVRRWGMVSEIRGSEGKRILVNNMLRSL